VRALDQGTGEVEDTHLFYCNFKSSDRQGWISCVSKCAISAFKNLALLLWASHSLPLPSRGCDNQCAMVPGRHCPA